MDNMITYWYCDVCGEKIYIDSDEIEKTGIVIWKKDSEGIKFGFKIVHKVKCDDLSYTEAREIKDFLGEEGIKIFLSLLCNDTLNLQKKNEIMVRNIKEFIDLFQRLQIPYYEEFRKDILTKDFNNRYKNQIYSKFIDFLIKKKKHKK